MARPARLYPHPTITTPALALINVNDITDIIVSGVNLTLQRNKSGTTDTILQSFATQEEALAAAEVWRARVDDAP